MLPAYDPSSAQEATAGVSSIFSSGSPAIGFVSPVTGSTPRGLSSTPPVRRWRWLSAQTGSPVKAAVATQARQAMSTDVRERSTAARFVGNGFHRQQREAKANFKAFHGARDSGQGLSTTFRPGLGRPHGKFKGRQKNRRVAISVHSAE